MTAERKPIKNSMRVILDSNALFVPLQFKIDIFEELKKLLGVSFDPVLLSPIKQELETLASQGPPQMRKNASCALKLAENCSLARVEYEAPPDDVIVKTACEWRCPVFTNDKQLRKRLRDINVPVIYVRQKSRLEIDGRL